MPCAVVSLPKREREAVRRLVRNIAVQVRLAVDRLSVLMLRGDDVVCMGRLDVERVDKLQIAVCDDGKVVLVVLNTSLTRVRESEYAAVAVGALEHVVVCACTRIILSIHSPNAKNARNIRAC